VSTYKQKKSTNEKFYLLILLDLLFSLKSFCVTIDWLRHSFDGCNKSHVMQLNLEVWFCKKCVSDIFPFTSLDEFEFDALVHSDKPSDIELLPPLM